MKKQIITLLAIISILASSCDKKELYPNVPYFGEAIAFKNEQQWKPLIYATHNKKEPNYIYITMGIHDKQGIQREVLFLNRVPKEVGYSSIKPRGIIEGFPYVNNERYYASYYTLVADGDVVCSFYQVDDSVEVAGYVNVTKYDEKSGVLEGNFEVTLVKNYNCDESALDTLHFTEGVFYTRVQED